MKKWVALFFVCIFANSFSQTNISPQFSELKGMEDQLGNTHLFYRICKDSTWGEYYFYQSNHVYKINVMTGTDSFFLPDYAYENETGQYFFRVNDYDFWDDDEYKYIYCGGGGDFYSYTYVKRFDDNNFLFGDWQGSVSKINISKQNDSLIFIGSWATDITGQNPIRTSKSTDGGYTWSTISDSLQLLAVRPDNEQQLFCYNDNGYIANYNGGLYKSTNVGVNFNLVDSLKKCPSAENDEIVFDANASNIFRLFETLYGDFVLRISLNNGEQFSWETKYSSDTKIFISNDASVSGTIYLADKKNIFISTDYGNNFSLYKTLERKIVGIYKKPNSNKLYAATKYKIYEITPDTIHVIKSLPAIDDLQWYPLSIGNKWVFENYRQEFDSPDIKEFIGFSTMEVLGDTSAAGQNYYLLKDEPLYWNIDTGLIRIDSLEAKLFIYLPEEGKEILYEDFLAQVGDTIWIDSVEYKVFDNEEPFSVWGMNTYKRIIDYQFRFQGYELVKDIGLLKWGFSDFFAIYTKELKGCIIDGVVYGDTTTVGVEDEENPIASNFKLEQNYPNPFNPSTKIKFTIPVVETRHASSLQLVTLKVFDILGNEIATLVNEEKPAGEYEVEFNSHSDEGKNLSSGIYFYQLVIRGSEINSEQVLIQTKKMIYLK